MSRRVVGGCLILSLLLDCSGPLNIVLLQVRVLITKKVWKVLSLKDLGIIWADIGIGKAGKNQGGSMGKDSIILHMSVH